MHLARVSDVSFGCFFNLVFAALVALEASVWRLSPSRVANARSLHPNDSRAWIIQLCLALAIGEKLAFAFWTGFTKYPVNLSQVSYLRFGATAALITIALVTLVLRQQKSWRIAAGACAIALAIELVALFLDVRFVWSTSLVLLPASLLMLIWEKPYSRTIPFLQPDEL
jgi:hypothetical protein